MCRHGQFSLARSQLSKLISKDQCNKASYVLSYQKMCVYTTYTNSIPKSQQKHTPTMVESYLVKWAIYMAHVTHDVFKPS